jgi:LmbE family N-acetylglucosaminyl deacetylase
MTPVTELSGRAVVVSPHLDDAALSLGATIAAATARGGSVVALTVFAGDPESTVAAGTYDRSCGYRTAGEAAVARRDEDRRACGVLGAVPEWLPFGDAQYERGGGEDEIWAAVEPFLDGADAVLVPGFPLVPPDHRWITELVLARAGEKKVGLYVEQPYAAFSLMGRGGRGYTGHLSYAATLGNLAALAVPTRHGRRLATPPAQTELPVGPVAWSPTGSDTKARRRKHKALHEYGSQLPALGRLTTGRIALYERAFGGEAIARVGASDGPTE